MIGNTNLSDVSRLAKPINQITLSEKAEKAVWATAILKILKGENRFKTPYLSFRDSFRQIELYHKRIRFSQAIRDKMLQLYQPTEKFNSKFEPWICPQLFNKDILNKTGIIQCQAGSGMTTLVLFLIKLSLHQTRFYYEIKKKSKYWEELQMLVKQRLLDNQICKIWYWPIKDADLEERSSEFLKALFFSQAVELTPSQLKQMKILSKQLPIYKFLSKLLALYPSRIKMRTIIDEAHIVQNRFEWLANEAKFNLRKNNLSQAKIGYYSTIFEKQKLSLRLFNINVYAFQNLAKYNQIIASSNYRSSYTKMCFNDNDLQLFRSKISKKQYFQKAFLFELQRNLANMEIRRQLIVEIKSFVLKTLIRYQCQDYFRFSDIQRQLERAKIFQRKPDNAKIAQMLAQEIAWMLKNWNALFTSDNSIKFGSSFSGKEWFESPIK